jgi:predicted AlkP superfamily pyrophosphatase or phosphodiesterase
VPTDSAALTNNFYEYPWMDEMILAATLEGVNALRLGDGGVPDLLKVSLSTTDANGHRYGPDSREVHDQILRLDRALGAFIDSLYRLRDSSGIIFVLTADHGVTPFPELRPPPAGSPAPRRVSIGAITTRYRNALVAMGVPRSAFLLEESMLMVDREAFVAARVDADSVLRAYTQEILSQPGVARVDDPRALVSRDTVRDPISRRWVKAVPPDLAVERVITLTPGSIWGSPGSAATHGTPYDSDTHVPLIFYGSMFRRGTYPERASVADIAPTLARVLRVLPTERLDGRVLTTILR